MSHRQTFWDQNCPIGSHLNFFCRGTPKNAKNASFYIRAIYSSFWYWYPNPGYHHENPHVLRIPMVVPWIWYSIWKFWVIYVLVSLVFHVFSTAELISPCKTVNLAVWAFSSIFLHDFTLFGIDMNYIYHISSIATIFGPLSKVTILGQKCMAILGIRLKQGYKTRYRRALICRIQNYHYFWVYDILKSRNGP